jgi:hypothetical protein
MVGETEVNNLQRLVGVQPPYLTLLGLLVPGLALAFLGFVMYQIWKLLKDDDDAAC